jgi:hypothetical protein
MPENVAGTTDHMVRLRDGRRLSFAQYGDPDGNGAQGITGTNNSGLQSGVSSVNSAAQAAVPATTSAVSALNGLVKFSVQGLLGK